MPNYGSSRVDSATLSLSFVTIRLSSTTFAVMFLVAACMSPVPVAPTSAPAPAQGTPVPPDAATTGAARPVPAPHTPPTAAALAPIIPDGLSAEQRATFRQARLLQIEGDYDAAAD